MAVETNWPLVRLGDLVQVKHGWPFKSKFFSEELSGRPVVINIGNFQYTGGFRFASTTNKEYRADYPREYELTPGEIILAMTCQTPDGEILGIPGRVPADGRTYLHNQRLGRVIVKQPAVVIRDFLYWLFLSREFNRELVATASGTKILHTAPSRIENFRFRLPPVATQRRIAGILGPIDDKIELNRRINGTLEDICRAIFKSWFVDFDPVHAKAALRREQPTLANAELSRRALPNLDPQVAELFPDSFADSELGPIPTCWQVGTLDEGLESLETGSRPRGGVKHIATGVPSIGAESIVGLGMFDYAKTKYVPPEFYDSMVKGRLQSHDVLLYKDGGRPGEYEPHVTLFGLGFPFNRCCINEHVYRLRANRRLSQEFIYFWLTTPSLEDEMRVKGTGVAIPGLNSTAVRSLTTLFPGEPVVKAYTGMIAPIVAKVLTACKQSRELSVTRDQLLPRLMTAELATTAIVAEATA